MRRAVVIGASLLCLFAGAAYAQEGQSATPEDPCHQEISKTENAIGDKMESGDLPELTQDRIDELLDNADADCSAGNAASASEKLKEVRKLAK